MRTSPLAGPAALGALTALFASVQVTTITQRAIAELGAWAPSVDEMRRDLSASPPPEADVAPYVAWQGMPMHHAGGMDARAIADAQRAGMAFFDGYAWTRATSERWPIALGAVALYLAAIPLLRRVVAARAAPFDVKRFALWWNAGLSLFSWVGLAACAPVLLGALARNGLHFTTCAPAMWYGQVCGTYYLLMIIVLLMLLLLMIILLILRILPIPTTPSRTSRRARPPCGTARAGTGCGSRCSCTQSSSSCSTRRCCCSRAGRSSCCRCAPSALLLLLLLLLLLIMTIIM